MAIERIDSIYDLQALQVEQEKYLAILKESKEAIIELNNTRVGAKNTSLTGLTDATVKLDEAIKKTTTTTEKGVKENARLQESIKAVNKVITDRFASEAKLATVTTDYNKQTIANRTETARLNQEVKNTVQAEQAAVGSRDRARAQIKVLTAEKDKLNLINKDEAAQYDVIVAKLEKYENFLKRTGSAAEKQRINIGNYPQVGNFGDAFGVLTKELDEVRAKLKTSLDTASLKKFEQEEKLLTQLTENLGKAFKSPTQELRAFTAAAKEIGQQMGNGSKVFNEFVAQVGDKQDELKDIQATINFQGSDTKYLDGIVSAVSGLAAGYGVAESAQQLFGDGSEDLQKEMVKLQAILTLVTSLQTILNTVQTESGAIQVALAAKTGVMNAARSVQAVLSSLLTKAAQAEVVATTEQTVVTEAATVATDAQVVSTEAAAASNLELAATAEAGTAAMAGETVATEAATVATSEFATALIATGIGAVIVAIAAGVVYLVTKIQDWNAATASQVKANAELSKSMGDLVSATREYEALRSASAAAEIKSLEQIIANRKSAGITAAQGLALDKQLAAQNLKNANEQAAIYNITAATVKKAKADAESQAEIVRNTERQKRDYIAKTTEVQDKNYERTVEVLDNLIKKNQEQANATKAIYDFANENYQKQIDAQAQIDNIGVQEGKLAADERRKFVLESARIEADAVTAKNALILSDERSTLTQRLIAIRSNAAAQKAIVQAQLRDVQNDPTKKGTVEEQIAVKQAAEERVKITAESNRAVFDTEEGYRKRRLAADLDLDKTLLNADKTLQDQIIENQFGALDMKVASAAKAAQDQEDILTKEYAHTKATTVLTNEELLALDATYNQALVQLDYDTAKRMQDIQEKATADLISEINRRQKAQFDATNDRVDIASDSAATNVLDDGGVAIASANGAKRVALEAKLQHDITKIDNDAAMERLKIQADELLQELGAAQLIEAPTTDIEKRITKNKREQAALRNGITKAEYDYEKAIRDKKLDQQYEFEKAGLELLQTVGDSRFDNEKNRLKDQQDLDDKNTQREIEAVNASTRSEADKAAAITIIQERAAARKEQMDARQKKLDYEKAKFDRQIAILTVVAQIAIATAKKDYAAAALAGIALIKLIATTLPKYRGGRGFGKDEMALVHEGEYIHREDGSIQATPPVETLTHLMPRDRVYKNKATMLKELALSSAPLPGMAPRGVGEDMSRFASRIEDAISDIKITTQLVTKDGWRTHNNRLETYSRWVDKNIRN